MALAGETEVIADHAERFICELQQMFPLFQFTAQYKCAECETKLFFEISGKVGSTESYMIGNFRCCDRTVDVLKNILDRPLQCFVGSLWDQFVFYFLGKCKKHLQIQILDGGGIV